jgi:mono/diheme cytochrome c family protein
MNKTAVIFLGLMTTMAGIALAADATSGAEVYRKTCAGCHGADGATPNENMGKMLGATIPTLASPKFQSSTTDAEIRTAITQGKGKMPAMKSVTPPQVDDLIAYIRSLKK